MNGQKGKGPFYESKPNIQMTRSLNDSDEPPDAPSHSCVFTEGVTMARDLGRRLGLRGVLVEESESWESWTVTQLMTFVRWFTLQLPHKRRENFFERILS